MHNFIFIWHQSQHAHQFNIKWRIAIVTELNMAFPDSSISSLPEYELLMIFRYLDASDLAHCTDVCGM